MLIERGRNCRITETVRVPQSHHIGQQFVNRLPALAASFTFPNPLASRPKLGNEYRLVPLSHGPQNLPKQRSSRIAVVGKSDSLGGNDGGPNFQQLLENRFLDQKVPCEPIR